VRLTRLILPWKVVAFPAQTLPRLRPSSQHYSSFLRVMCKNELFSLIYHDFRAPLMPIFQFRTKANAVAA
jgi:hypothetical protein